MNDWLYAFTGYFCKKIQFMALLIKNIKQLVQVEQHPVNLVSGKDMATVHTIEDAFLFVEDGKIAAFGKMNRLSDSNYFWDGKRLI